MERADNGASVETHEFPLRFNLKWHWSRSSKHDVLRKMCHATEICNHQSKKLGESVMQVNERMQEQSKIAMKEILHRGIKLTKSCKKKHWEVRTLIHGDSREDFKDIHCDLLYVVSPSYTSHSGLDLRHSETAADKDREHLLQMCRKEGATSTLQKQRLLDVLLSENQARQADLHIDFNQVKNVKAALGKGNFSEAVYETSCFGHRFAVKVFAEGSPSFQRELSFTFLRHPNIVSVVGYSCDKDKKRDCIIMEKMDKDLDLVILKRKKRHPSRPPFESEEAISIMLQIAKGMQFLHSRNVMHRDLKTENILVVDSNAAKLTVKIGDFGASTVNDGQPKSPRKGTVGFRAPEVYAENPAVYVLYDIKVDVFSFAMVCFHILTGEIPFESEPLPERDGILREGRRPDLRDVIDIELKSLIESCWSTSADDRPSFDDISSSLRSIRKRINAEKSL